MAGDRFKALLLEEAGGKLSAKVTEVETGRLPPGDVTIAIECSTLNYKDGMVIKGLGKLVRSYPHVPGIDFAGRVIESAHPDWHVGDKVVLTGWHVGERQWGGYAQRARVKGDWLVALPSGLSAQQAMAIGTAGFTSMLAVLALERHNLTPDDGDVLVTGAAGGVGSIAVAILAKLGYRVVASTGRMSEAPFLKSLGAAEVIDRAVLGAPTGRPLDTERWGGCIDAVGGTTLATALSQMKLGAAVASCGLAGGPKLETTVMPFLLRGVALLGIDSVLKPMPWRRTAWQRLQHDLPLDKLNALTTYEPLGRVPELADEILAGRVRGRVVVDVNA
ncbi:MAG: oxidoreductase [Alphaproteobacteria bacterium]|nr:oxidoreductase [Alphaproteobacteria bacterium]